MDSRRVLAIGILDNFKLGDESIFTYPSGASRPQPIFKQIPSLLIGLSSLLA